ncbi:MAG: hypothetical protein J2P48_04135 [Alphaproteobacteria bacterium]|nr:hypothetical protein [Alphaproteobacteria bacterium]
MITKKYETQYLLVLLLVPVIIVALPYRNADALPNDLDLTAAYCLGVALNALERHRTDLETPGGPNLLEIAQDRVHRINQYLHARGLLPQDDHFNEKKPLAAPIAKGREDSEAAWRRAGRNKKCSKGCDARDPVSYYQCLIRCGQQFPITPANDKCAKIESRLPF